MGYTTEFTGEFDVEPALKPEHIAYLKQFAETRRMKRDAGIADEMEDPIREAACLPVGPEGSFFVGGGGCMGQDHDESIEDYNSPPVGQPGLWCHWVPTDDGKKIEWDLGEKFYKSDEWINYLIENFLDPWGYSVSGQVEFQGEEPDDYGYIEVVDGEVYKRFYAAT
jgi:hypothetical protein